MRISDVDKRTIGGNDHEEKPKSKKLKVNVASSSRGK